MIKKYKNTIIFIMRIVIILSLVNLLLEYIQINSEEKIKISEYFNLGLRSVYTKLSDNEKNINFIKIITILSIYLSIEFNLIKYIANLSESMKEIVKYHSKSKINYISNLIKISNMELLKNNIIWLISIWFLSFQKMRISQLTLYDAKIILQFLLINYIMNLILILISNTSLLANILYISKIFILIIFLGREMNLILLILIILIILLFDIEKLGEKIWKLKL